MDAAAAREAALAVEQEAMQEEMKARVASVMDLMKTTRLSLSQKLMQSQSTCEALAQELQAHLSARCAAPRCCASSARLCLIAGAHDHYLQFNALKGQKGMLTMFSPKRAC